MNLKTLLSRPAAMGALLLALLVPLVGCGGSNNDPANNPVTFDVRWPSRSRATSGPGSALSFRLTATKADQSGSNVTVTADRNANATAYTQTYTSSDRATSGSYLVGITFYANTNATGDVVAQGNTTLDIQSDGSGINTIAVDEKVKTVAVSPGQIVSVAGSKLLTFEARGADGALLALSAGSATWTQMDGALHVSLQPDGLAVGTSAGTSNVKVTVDNVVSLPVLITVPGIPEFRDGGFETLAITPGLTVEDNAVTGIPWSGTTQWGIANGSGSVGTNGHSGNQYAFLQAKNNSLPNVSGSVSQTVTDLTIGQTYQFSFWVARKNGPTGTNTGAAIVCTANGVNVMNNTLPTPGGGWTKLTTRTFSATSETYIFTIASVLPNPTDDTTTLLDDVHLELVF